MRTMLLTSAAAIGLALAATTAIQPASAAQGTDRYSATRAPSPHRLMHEGMMNPATGARWGHVPGVGISLPTSPQASNITPGDTRSIIAPTLPKPGIGPNANAEEFLAAARRAIANHQTGVAQEALERAETRRLDFDSARNVAPSDDPMIGQIHAALLALADRNFAAVDQQIAGAMSMGPAASNLSGEGTGAPMSPTGSLQ